MKIDKVSLSRTIPTGPYMNDKIGIEATLDSGESYGEALNQLNHLITQWHREANPHLYQEGKIGELSHEVKGGSPGIIQLQNDEFDVESPLSLIQNATDLDTLKSFKVIASSDTTKVLYNAYNKRLKELM